MENVQLLLEKVAAAKKQKPKQRKKKPAGGRKAKDVYAPDMSKGAPGTKKPKAEKIKPAKDLTSKAKSFKADNPKPKDKPLQKKKVVTGKAAKSFRPTLHDKVDALTKQVSSVNKPKAAPKKPKFTPKKLGLIAGGAAGAGILAAKVRANRKAQENS